MEITKGQHFVWRKYLENWSVKDKVFVKYIKRNVLTSSSTSKILRENYMYEFPILNELDLGELKRFISNLNFNDGEVDEIFLNFVTIVSRAFRVGKLPNNDIPKIKNGFFRKTIKEGFEPFYTQTELLGQDLVAITSAEELASLLSIDYSKISLFLLLQYFRTQNMKSKLSNLLSKDSEPLRKAKSLLTPILMAYDIASQKTPSFKLLVNNSTESFVTSEQPVINIARDTDEKGNYLDFVLYYPINPKLAIEVSFSNDEMYVERESCNHIGVQWYNKIMLENDIIISDIKLD
ncbi:DUF4238 domain-containing protein [Agrobacterium tumefaciens]|nr:DUF4238 domain-containing protein [Agrobacterium tumefaciens]NTE25062.1 DUF4238 domain-containing protein [Agrobacterium tumefaciens]